MLINKAKAIKNYIDTHVVEMLILLVGGFGIFAFLPSMPYLNIILGNYLIKMVLLWTVFIAAFNISHKRQMLVYLTFMFFSVTSYLLGNSSYEVLGIVLYAILLLVITTYLFQKR